MALHTPSNSTEFANVLSENGYTLSPGDIIELTPGVNYDINSTLPSKGLTDKIIIRSAGYANWNKHRYSRATAADLPNMATIRPTGNSALSGPYGAGWYEFYGLNFANSNTAVSRLALLNYGIDNSTSTNPYPVADLPKLVVRHCVFADATNMRNGIVANTGLCIIESNTIGPVLKNGEETHGIVQWSGLGPYLIQNNKISANMIGVLFGGASSIIAGTPPPRGIFRCNHVYADPAWGSTWTIKNLLEFKHVDGFLVEGNVFSGNWVSAQSRPYLFNDTDDTTGHMRRVTTRYNKWYDTGGWWTYGYNLKPAPCEFLFHDNLCIAGHDPRDDSNFTYPLFGWHSTIKSIVWHHNTIIAANDGTNTATIMLTLSPAHPNQGNGSLVFRDNILIMGWKAGDGLMLGLDSGGANKAALDYSYGAGTYTWTNNAICREDTIFHAMPTTNDYYTGGTRVADMLAKLESNYAVKAVQSGTDWNTYGSDGGRIGCNIPLLEQWIDGVEAGEPTALKRGMHLPMGVAV